jgi:cytochrome c oxidase subunit 3
MLIFKKPILREKLLIDSSNSSKGHFHSFHLVRPSYAPIFCALSALFLVLSAVSYFHYKAILICVITSLTLLVSGMIIWWQEVVEESYVYHTSVVKKGLRLGFILFIVSEIMFFFGFFWGFFHSSLSPSIFIGGIWPPPGIVPFNPWTVPLANTLVLLLSGCSITWAHHSFLSKPKISPYTIATESEVTDTRTAFFVTLVLAVCFTCLQLLEYCEAPFSISDSVYGSTFFLMTGFHGLHVIIGTIFIAVCFVRFLYGRLTLNQHLGFEFAAWYWHFVDVVWLFLFISVYWWGGSLFDSTTGFELLN